MLIYLLVRYLCHQNVFKCTEYSINREKEESNVLNSNFQSLNFNSDEIGF